MSEVPDTVGKSHITFLPRWSFPILLEVPDSVGKKYSWKTSYDSKKVIWLFHHHMIFSDNENENYKAKIFCMDVLRFLSNFLWWEAIISDFLKSYLTIKRRSRNISSVHSHRWWVHDISYFVTTLQLVFIQVSFVYHLHQQRHFRQKQQNWWRFLLCHKQFYVFSRT